MLAKDLKEARRLRGWSQQALAERVGRPRARISELDHDLGHARLGRDRLTLLADLCSALDLVPVLVPQSRLTEFQALLRHEPPEAHSSRPASTFDEIFIDLSDEDPA